MSYDSPHTPKTWITVAGHKFNAIVDSGATINVIDSDTFANLHNVKLLHTSTKAYPYQQDRREGGGVTRVVTRGPGASRGPVENKVCIFGYEFSISSIGRAGP